jgi:hypothetical protein
MTIPFGRPKATGGLLDDLITRAQMRRIERERTHGHTDAEFVAWLRSLPPGVTPRLVRRPKN